MQMAKFLTYERFVEVAVPEMAMVKYGGKKSHGRNPRGQAEDAGAVAKGGGSDDSGGGDENEIEQARAKAACLRLVEELLRNSHGV
jgi:hypothetical protein